MRPLLIMAALAIAARAQSTGAVEGVVLNTATGRPVAGAAVILEGVQDGYVVESDANGHFQAYQVVPGPYQVKAQRDGFTVPNPKRIRQIAVVGAEQVTALELRLIPLGAIAGKVVDADGDPVSNTMVEAVRFSYAHGRKELKAFGRSKTDDRGEFRIADLATGSYYLKGAVGFFFQRTVMSSMKVLGPKPAYEFAPTFFPSAGEPASAVLLELPAGGELRNNTITLRPQQTYTIRCTLTGNPAAGSRPTMSMGSPSGGMLMFDTKYGVTQQFPNSAPGTYLLQGEDRALGLSARQFVKVTNSDMDVTLALRPEIIMQGSVRVEGKRVPLEGVRVRLEAGESMDRAEATVKGDGSFVIRRVQPVAYQVLVTTPPGTYVKSISLGEHVLKTPQLHVEGGGTPPAITLGTDGGAVDGMAVDAKGSPLGGAVVLLAPVGAMREWTDRLRSTFAGDDGKFAFHDLAPGDYLVFAWEDVEEGAPLDADFRKSFEKQAVGVHIEAGKRESVQVTGM